jgi:hypothetical protein
MNIFSLFLIDIKFALNVRIWIVIFDYLAFEIFDEKRSISNSPTVVHTIKTDKSTNYLPDESSTSEERSLHRKDAELLVNKLDFFFLFKSDSFRTKKDSDTSSISTEQRQSG